MLTIREHRYPFLDKVGDWNRFNRNTGGTFVEKCCHFFDLMRLILKSDPVRVMASGGQAVNHLDERYDGGAPDIWDHGYVLVDFANGARAMLELCMFAEGSRYQEEISAVGGGQDRMPGARAGPLLAGASRCAAGAAGDRQPAPSGGTGAARSRSIPTLLAAGDHNGSTFYQHGRFVRRCAGKARSR